MYIYISLSIIHICKLRDRLGNLVPDNKRAEAQADYFEKFNGNLTNQKNTNKLLSTHSQFMKKMKA